MPRAVKNSMTVTILTTLFTSLGLAMLLFFGRVSIGSIATATQVEVLTASQENTNKKIDSVLVFVSKNTVNVAKLEVKAQHCQDELTLCKTNQRN